MADVDIDPFGEHELRPDETGGGGEGESIPLTPVERSILELESEQETSFGGLLGARARLNAGFVEDKVNGLYEILSEHFPKNQNVIDYDNFESIRGELYFKGRMNP